MDFTGFVKVGKGKAVHYHKRGDGGQTQWTECGTSLVREGERLIDFTITEGPATCKRCTWR